MKSNLTRNDKYRLGVDDKTEARIIGIFKTSQMNHSKVIASRLNISEPAVSHAINRYLYHASNVDYMIVESKMNDPDFDLI